MINPSELNLFLLPFVALEERSQLPSVPCIYFAIDSLGAVQYIGRSNNVRVRWTNHHRCSDLETIEKVCDYFHCGINDLFVLKAEAGES